jgi:hypothetical protein
LRKNRKTQNIAAAATMVLSRGPSLHPLPISPAAQTALNNTCKSFSAMAKQILGKVLHLHPKMRVFIPLPKEFRTSQKALTGVGGILQTTSIPAARTTHLGTGLTCPPRIRAASDILKLKKKRPTALGTHLGRN